MLKRVKPLTRRTPIKKRKHPIKRKQKRINRFSKKLRKDLKIYYPLRDLFLIENPVCQCGRNGCQRPSEDVHHKKGRGIYLLVVKYFLAVSRVCHDWIGAHPEEAIKLGLSLLKHTKQMTRDQIIASLTNILVSQYDADREDINPDATLSDDFNMDSLDVVEFIMTVEREFNLIIPDSIGEEIKTFKDVVDYLEKYVGEK